MWKSFGIEIISLFGAKAGSLSLTAGALVFGLRLSGDFRVITPQTNSNTRVCSLSLLFVRCREPQINACARIDWVQWAADQITRSIWLIRTHVPSDSVRVHLNNDLIVTAHRPRTNATACAPPSCADRHVCDPNWICARRVDFVSRGSFDVATGWGYCFRIRLKSWWLSLNDWRAPVWYYLSVPRVIWYFCNQILLMINFCFYI
jgi:hypothetical protein